MLPNPMTVSGTKRHFNANEMFKYELDVSRSFVKRELHGFCDFHARRMAKAACDHRHWREKQEKKLIYRLLN